MKLKHDFRVDAPPGKAWEVLTDIPTIAPCMPGAELQGVEGEEYRGIVKVKLGPITAQYKGVARFVEKDDDAHRAVLGAEGRETRGQGNAQATITAQLEPYGDGTRVAVTTDLMITGKVAQFGRGVLADVSSKLLDQFASCLEAKLAGGSPVTGSSGPADADAGAAGGDGSSAAGRGVATGAASAEAGPIPASTVPGATAPAPVEAVDLLGAAGAPVGKRLLPVVILGAVVFWLLRRRRRSRQE